MEECSVSTNKRAKYQDNEDRISALPDSLLQHILSFLPSTREAIRTGILSKTWQNQWTHVPVLIFEPRDKEFIENVLMLHNCPNIKELYLKYDYLPHPQFASIIGVAIGKRVEELTLFCDDDAYSLPEFLFDCSSLVRLKMLACHFWWFWTVSWPSLKSLEIDCHALRLDNRRSQRIGHAVWGSPMLESFEFRGIMWDRDGIVSKSLKKLTLVDVDVPAGVLILCRNLVELHVLADRWFESTFPHRMIEDVLSDNPNIHTLELLNVTGFGDLVIASNSLKVLRLKLRYYPQRQPTKIEVSCPNLEKLDVLCFFDAFHAVNLSSSTEAALDYSCPRNDESVKGMLEQFRGVNELALESSFFWIISDSVSEIHISLPMLNSKCLTLNVGANFGLALPGIVYALRLPALETLVIKLKSMFYMRESDKDLQDLIMSKLHNWFSNGSGGHTCLVSNLKTVKIIGLNQKDDKCKVALEFIEFLFKNARVLKSLIVVLKEPGTGFAIEVSEKLVSFPRCSPSASIELSCST